MTWHEDYYQPLARWLTNIELRLLGSWKSTSNAHSSHPKSERRSSHHSPKLCTLSTQEKSSGVVCRDRYNSNLVRYHYNRISVPWKLKGIHFPWKSNVITVHWYITIYTYIWQMRSAIKKTWHDCVHSSRLGTYLQIFASSLFVSKLKDCIVLIFMIYYTFQPMVSIKMIRGKRTDSFKNGSIFYFRLTSKSTKRDLKSYTLWRRSLALCQLH